MGGFYMENNKKINVNGQLLFVEPEWITGKTCLFNVTNMNDYLKGMAGLTKIRKEFLKHLESEGFVITNNKFDTENDIIYLIMNDKAICTGNEKLGTYKKAFDQRMIEAGGETLNYPYSLSMETYFKAPFYPAVFKNESTNGGIDKFLIESPEQLEIIKKFYEKYKEIEMYKSSFECSIFQQLIETPTEHQTYMRVLMSASGDVMGASLKYSRIIEKKREPKGLYEKHFWNEKSEFYLNSKGMFNYYSKGGDINLTNPRLNYVEKEILREHGIDPENPTVPSAVLEVASSIASKCNKELGILCGFDFILDKNTNKWYYLENQAFPSVDEWVIAKRKRTIDVRNINDYIKVNVQDLEARYEALMMLMAKKQKIQDNKKLILTKNK